MRLLNTNTLKLEQFEDRNVPAYAILCDSWDDLEVTFTDMPQHSAQEERGYGKIRDACRKAINDGFQRIWISAYCVDKTNIEEMKNAISSMYTWYQNAEVCYVYLVEADERSNKLGETDQTPTRSSWSGESLTLGDIFILQCLLYDRNMSGNYASVNEGIKSHISQATRYDSQNAKFEYEICSRINGVWSVRSWTMQCVPAQLYVAPIPSRHLAEVARISIQDGDLELEDRDGKECSHQQNRIFQPDKIIIIPWLARPLVTRYQTLLPKTIWKRLSQVTMLYAISLASSTAAMSVLMWNYVDRQKSEKLERLYLENSTKSGANDPANMYQLLGMVLEGVIDDKFYHQAIIICPFVTYAASLIYLTNRQEHCHQKGSIALLVTASASVTCAILRTRDQFMSSLLVEFLPFALIVAEVASLLVGILQCSNMNWERQ